MSKDNLKVTIGFPSLGKEVKTDTDTIQKLAKDLKNERGRKKGENLAYPFLPEVHTIPPKENICQHKKTVALNEEGHAGVYCVDCDEQLEKEC